MRNPLSHVALILVIIALFVRLSSDAAGGDPVALTSGRGQDVRAGLHAFSKPSEALASLRIDDYDIDGLRLGMRKQDVRAQWGTPKHVEVFSDSGCPEHRPLHAHSWEDWNFNNCDCCTFRLDHGEARVNYASGIKLRLHGRVLFEQGRPEYSLVSSLQVPWNVSRGVICIDGMKLPYTRYEARLQGGFLIFYIYDGIVGQVSIAREH